MQKIIFYLYAVLLFLTPLVLWPFTSEVFEFNKMVLVYILTILIAATWLTRFVLVKKFIFRRTLLDIPLLVFLASQVISTVLSIDFYTSITGYYSRFNGGLISTICYITLYWVFVSSFEQKETKKLINYYLLPSAFLVSVYGILEHFGIDKHIWVQDVQSRVFSTLGQPNWLAAWIVALIPLTWAGVIKSTENPKVKLLKLATYSVLFIIFFWTLIFTKSRSGILGFFSAYALFWGLIFWQNRKSFKSILAPFSIVTFLVICIGLISGTPWTPNIKDIIYKAPIASAENTYGTALETGGTESGTIRKIVWKGALEIWKHYPIFGTGVETFAYSYYKYRPPEHNLTSEWDFIYNKAHNEFLNMAANSGTIGLLSYLVLICASIYQIVKFKTNSVNLISTTKSSKSYIRELLDINYNSELLITRFALLAGFISLSVSNFFGFSVVPTQLLFFLFPAIAFAITKKEEVKAKSDTTISSVQKIAIAALLLFTFYLLFLTCRYWYSDILYAKAKAHNSQGRGDLAYEYLETAIKQEPWQSIYLAESSLAYSSLAVALSESAEATSSAQLVSLARDRIQRAAAISPANINIKRQMFGIFIRLSVINEEYLPHAKDVLKDAIEAAPTDPKLYFNLGVSDANLGHLEDAKLDFEKAISLKPNYIDARIQYAALLVHLKNIPEAKVQLEYILKNIDPKNETAIQALENLK